MNNRGGRSGSHSESPPMECPDCGEKAVTTNYEFEEFPYGEAPDTVTLKAHIPLRTCNACGFSYADHDAEVAREAAVRLHLGLLPPAEIVATRKAYELNRSEYATITGIGEASLARWESGKSRQNRALDCYMFLTGFPENLQRLCNRLRFSKREMRGEGPRFRALEPTARLEAAARDFRLHDDRDPECML